MVRGIGREDRNSDEFSDIRMAALKERERLAVQRQDIAYQRLRAVEILRAERLASKADCDAKICQKDHDPLFYYCSNEKLTDDV
jgi:hypothetical protein